MKSVIIKKENGEVRIINANLELLKFIKSEYSTNPCFDCKNASPARCQKLFDGEGKDITRYDFITDGYQVYDEEGTTESLVVCKCSDFVQDEPRKKPTTREEIEKLNRLKASIKILYFDAGDIEEADNKQYNLLMRGSLVEYKSGKSK